MNKKAKISAMSIAVFGTYFVTINCYSAQSKSNLAKAVVQTVLSPMDCLSKMDQLASVFYQKARDSNSYVDSSALRTRKAEFARKCVANYSINTITPQQFSALTILYFEAQLYSQADQVINLSLKSGTVSLPARAEIIHPDTNAS